VEPLAGAILKGFGFVPALQITILLMNVLMYSTEWCRDCRMAKQFLDEHGIDYTVVDVDDDPKASEELMHHVGKRAVPQLVIDGEWFQPYTPGRGLLYEELHQKLGISKA